MGLLIFYLTLAIAVSFLCSILEAVILSVTPSFVAFTESENEKDGSLLRSLKTDIDRPLSAILTLNTVAHTFGAAGVGAQAQVVFGNAYVSLTSVILTILILVFSEIIPKTLGATYWKKMAMPAARVTGFLIVITYPFVQLSKGITIWLSRGDTEPSLSREEFSAMAEQGFQEGIFEEDESDMFKNLIRFSTLQVQDIMTPRIVVVKFRQDNTVADVLDHEDDLRVSRIPVYGRNEEDITGYVLKTDLYAAKADGNSDALLSSMKREVLIIPETVSLKVLLKRLLEKKEHIAVVVDEYGGLAGVVTMEDLVETLLGIEIMDEADAIEDMQKLARDKWKDRARKLGIVIPESLE